MQRGVMCVLGGPQEKTIANRWWFQGSRIWNPHQGKISRRQGGNGLSGKALSSLSLETGKQRLNSQGMEGILALDGGWPLGTGFHLTLGL